MFAKYKKGIVIILVIILLFVVYNMLIKKTSNEDADQSVGSGSLLTSTVNAKSGSDIIGAEIIKALNQIDSLKLDKEIFSDVVYLSLIDRSQEIPPEPIGRNNPFAPLGSDISSVNTTSEEDMDE